MSDKFTLRGLLLFTALLCLAACGLFRANWAVASVMSAGVHAEDAFVAAHPYNAFVQKQFNQFQREAAKAEELKRPGPGWHPTKCESQTLDLRDYDRETAKAKAAEVWPLSMCLTIKAPKLRAFTDDCEQERSAYAKAMSAG